eukprot:m.271167 g.271167  ORF g.271167 m.271167 type:complete len:216 (+) comp15683_c0_seq2:875-1522(+)
MDAKCDGKCVAGDFGAAVDVVGAGGAGVATTVIRAVEGALGVTVEVLAVAPSGTVTMTVFDREDATESTDVIDERERVLVTGGGCGGVLVAASWLTMADGAAGRVVVGYVDASGGSVRCCLDKGDGVNVAVDGLGKEGGLVLGTCRMHCAVSSTGGDPLDKVLKCVKRRACAMGKYDPGKHFVFVLLNAGILHKVGQDALAEGLARQVYHVCHHF